MIRHIRLLMLLSALSFALGCIEYGAASGAFSYRFADNVEADVAAVLQTAPEPSADHVTNALGKPIVVATTNAEPREVVALDLESGEALWRRPMEAMTRPEIIGDVVMTSLRHEVVALDLESGEPLWRANLEGLPYVGATRVGDNLIYVLSVGATGGATRVGHIRAVSARSGRGVWDHEISGVLGHPQVYGRHVFVPWDRQNVAILDVTSGLETARLRTTDDVIAWVKAEPAGLFYGSRGIYRLTERSHTGTREEATYRETPIPDAPREPLVQDDGFVPMPGTRSARGRIRIYYEPLPSGDPTQVPVAGDRFYFAYFRYIFAFDGEQNLVWARRLEQDVIRAHALREGLLTIGEQGRFRVLAATTGNDLWTGGVEMELASAGLDVGDFAPDGDAGEPSDVRVALAEIAGDPDNRLVPARAFAIELLARREEPEITRDLLDLYAQRSTPGALREAIGTALRARPIGQEFLVSALEQRFDFLADTRVPPLELIVPALLEQRTEGAALGLVRHMLDHETPAEVLPLVVRGVVELGDENVVPALTSFLVLYHADSTFRETPDALAIAAEGIFRHGGAEGRELLQSITADGASTPAVAAAINSLFEREAEEAEALAQAEAAAAAEAAARADAEQAAARPARLSQAQINEVFIPQTDALRECIAAQIERNPDLAQVRAVFILESSGATRDWRFAPNDEEFVRCMEPKVTGLEFPSIRQRLQRASFTIQLRSAAATEESPEEIAAGPWWSRNQRRADDDVEIGRPWWEVRQAAARAATAATPTPTPERPGSGSPWWLEGQEAPSAPEGESGGASDDASQEPSGDGTAAEEEPWWLPTE